MCIILPRYEVAREQLTNTTLGGSQSSGRSSLRHPNGGESRRQATTGNRLTPHQRRNRIHVTPRNVAVNDPGKKEGTTDGVENTDREVCRAGWIGRGDIGKRDAGVDEKEHQTHNLHATDTNALPHTEAGNSVTVSSRCQPAM